LFLGCTDLLTAQFILDLTGAANVEEVGKTKPAELEGLWDYGKATRKGEYKFSESRLSISFYV